MNQEILCWIEQMLLRYLARQHFGLREVQEGVGLAVSGADRDWEEVDAGSGGLVGTVVGKP